MGMASAQLQRNTETEKGELCALEVERKASLIDILL